MRSSQNRKMIAALIPIYGITLIDVFGYMIMVPLLPYLAQHYGASGFEVGALLATMAVASVVAGPFWGTASDRLGRKPIVLISQFVSLAGYMMLAFAPSLTMLFVARAIAGIGGGNLGVTQSYIADVTEEKHRDKAYALFGAVFGIGIVLGPVTGGFLVQHGYRDPFLVAAGIEVINIVLAIRFLPATRTRAQRFDVLGSAKTVWAEPSLRRLIVRHFLFIFGVTYFFTTFSLFVKNGLHMGPQEASWLLAGTGIVGGIMLLIVVNPMTSRLGDARVAQIGMLLSFIAYVGLGFAQSLLPFVIVLAVWAAGASCIEPTISAILSKEAPPEKRGATLGINDAMSNVALMIAPSLGGWVIDRTITFVGIIPAAAVLAGFLLGLPGRSSRVPAKSTSAPA